MTLSAHALAAGSFVPMLKNLAALLEKGAAHAAAKNFETSVLAGARLAPDMYTFTRQIQLACHQAVDTMDRLAGRAGRAPNLSDETYEQSKERLARTIASIEGTKAADYEGSGEREIIMPMPNGVTFAMTGDELDRDWALPHFYFHAVTAYDLLRDNGVDIGKRDYLASVGRYVKSAPPS